MAARLPEWLCRKRCTHLDCAEERLRRRMRSRTYGWTSVRWSSDDGETWYAIEVDETTNQPTQENEMSKSKTTKRTKKIVTPKVVSGPTPKAEPAKAGRKPKADDEPKARAPKPDTKEKAVKAPKPEKKAKEAKAEREVPTNKLCPTCEKTMKVATSFYVFKGNRVSPYCKACYISHNKAWAASKKAAAGK